MGESKLAASLDHPNVIPIYAAGEHDGVLYIAMRFVPGHDLRTLLREEQRLEPERAARIIAQVASALDAAHAHGLVHRDVKPANVLMGAEDHVYLTDFGLSKRVAADAEATRTGMVLGTLDYVAPEQIRGHDVGPFTDVYSLGCMAVHLLTGQVAFPVDTEEGKLWAHFSEKPPQPGARVPELGKRFDAIVARALAKRPEDRFATAGELGAALLAAAGDDRPGAPAPAARAGRGGTQRAPRPARHGGDRAVQRRAARGAADRRRAARLAAADDPARAARLRRRDRAQHARPRDGRAGEAARPR